MSALTYPNTMANGQLADGDEVQENFDAVADKFAGSIDTDNLTKPYSIVEWTASSHPADGGVTYVNGMRHGDPSVVAWGFNLDNTVAGENELAAFTRFTNRQHVIVYGEVIADVSFCGIAEGFTCKIQVTSGSPEPSTPPAWTDIATATFSYSGTNGFYRRAVFSLLVPTIPASRWVRCILVNPTPVYTPPPTAVPPIWVRFESKVSHVA